MTTQPYQPPEYDCTAFNCPYCNAFSSQLWSTCHADDIGGDFIKMDELTKAICTHCGKYTLWHFKKMIYPPTGGIEPPNPDLSEEIKQDYLEAVNIVTKSPRGAAALLRLCIQKLCAQLGEKGNNINTDIAELVKKGLPVKIQQALDVVRVVGNDAVHPGTLDIKDDIDMATRLFRLINMIAHNRITEPKEINEMYNQLPQTKTDAIAKRNGKATP